MFAKRAVGAPTPDALAPGKCPACAGEEWAYLFVKQGQHFWRCRACSLERIHPIPSGDDLAEYYEHAYVEGIYKPTEAFEMVKRLIARYRFDKIRPRARPGRWLDVGTGDGIFVEHAHTWGVDCEGLELSQHAVAQARARGVLVHQGTLDDYDPGYTYDTITGFDVLEHVGNPSPFLSAVRRLLEADGIAFFTLPNQASVYRRCLGKQWFHYIPEEHMFYYNPGCLRRLLTMSNLEMIGWERAWKPLSLSYALIQLGEYGPIIHKTVSPFINILSERVREAFFPVYIGEMLITCRVASASAAS